MADSLASVDQQAYEFSGKQFSTYGFQYKPGFGDAYMAWISDGQLAWRLNVAGMSADNVVEISDRPVPQEPMVSTHVFMLFFMRVLITSTPATLVFDHELGYFRELRVRRLRQPCIPVDASCRLDSCVPGPEQYQCRL